MKLQYLGDSKDSFKWDYHDYLTSALGYPVLNIVLMLTPDDNTNHGETPSRLFPARKTIIDFCFDLKQSRDIELIRSLPSATNAGYRIDLHKSQMYLTNGNRKEYLSGLCREERQVLFLDPDNGFEPEKSRNHKHLLYSDVDAILDQVSETTVVSVFHHFRRVPFEVDFARIGERVPRGCITALYWTSLMFVAIGKKNNVIEKVATVNRQFAKSRPVSVLPLTTCGPGTSDGEKARSLFDL
jgi:hypothetical protein